MAVWPVSLPALSVVNDYTEEIAERALRTEMDQGPAKVRRLTNAMPDKLKFTQLLTKDQVATLDAFYKTTLVGGSTSFTDTHPRTGASVSLRFTKPPTYQFMGAIWKAAVELEVLP